MTPYITAPRTDFTNVFDIESQPARWLWPGRIPLGHITLIAGDPGVGKSTVAADIAARATREVPWPDASHPLFDVQPHHTEFGNFDIRPATVLYLASQDSLSATLRPRLEAAGADVERVIAASTTPQPQDLLDQLDILAGRKQSRKLIIIDPLSTYLRNFETSRSREATSFLESLANIAARHHLAIVGITHRSRAQRGHEIARLTSSVNLTAEARAVWTIKPHPRDPDRRLFLPTKNNIAPSTSGLAFSIEPAKTNQEIGQTIWEPEPFNAEEIANLRPSRTSETELAEAQQWLLAQLAAGPVPTATIKSHSAGEGFSWSSIRRAKTRLRIQASLSPELSTDREIWHWHLPHSKNKQTQTTTSAHTPNDVAPQTNSRAVT